jgi:hypothetical protein
MAVLTLSYPVFGEDCYFFLVTALNHIVCGQYSVMFLNRLICYCCLKFCYTRIMEECNMLAQFIPETLLYLYELVLFKMHVATIKMVLLQLLWLQQFHSQPCFHVGWDLCL